MNDGHWLTEAEVGGLPRPISAMDILGRYEASKFKALKDGSPRRARFAVTPKIMADIVKMLLGFKVTPRELSLYSSPRLALVPPPYKVTQGDFYLFPDHFDILAPVVTLRKHYHLPLNDLRQIMEAVPKERHHMIVSKRLNHEDLLELAKMRPDGFSLRDMVMASACQSMLRDLLPADQALLKAGEKGDGLDKLEERLLLERLDEIKKWIRAGQRRKYVHREAALDIRGVLENGFFEGKIGRKLRTAFEREMRSNVDKSSGRR